MQLHVGATLERPPAPKYYSTLSLVELSPRGPLLKPGTMARWRAQVPASARLSFVLPKQAWLAPRGALRFDDDTAHEWIETLKRDLRPTSLVLATGAELSPGPRDRELLARFAERVMRGGASLVWHAGGVWEAEAAHALGKELGLVVTWDPLEDELLSPGPNAYVRLRAIGQRSRLGEGLLLTLAERLLGSGADVASVAIESAIGIKKARALVHLLKGELAASDGEDDDADPGAASDGADEEDGEDDEDDEDE